MSEPAYMQRRRSFVCKYCGEVFTSMPKLAAHISHYHSSKRRKSRDQQIIELLQQLIQEVRGLRQDLRNLQFVEVKREIKETVRQAAASKPLTPKPSHKEPGNLPSFLQDNPWVQILSKTRT